MSAISFSGLATGLDTAGIVAQLVELKRRPIYRLQKRRSGYETQIKALSTFKDKLKALQSAANNMDTSSEFSSLKASSSDSDFFTVTADSDAAPGSFEIDVTKLATAQKEVSQGFDSNLDSMGTGIVSFTVDGETTDLTLIGYTSLQSLATKINNDVAGVSASLVNDGSGTGAYHLVLSSEAAGSTGAFTFDFSGLSGGVAPVMTNNQLAADAELTIDNIPVTATSNNPTDVISGLTLNLVDIGSATVTIERDSEGISNKVKALVDAYNDVFSFVTKNTAADGDLHSNPTLRAVASRIESIFTSSLDGGLGDKTLLAQVGIKRADARQIKFEQSDFDTALADDFSGVRDLFIEREGNLGKTYLIDQAIDDMTDSIDGLFKISTDAINKKIDYADQNIERYERGIESYQLTLTRRFTAMEQMVSQLQAQGNYLQTVMY